MADNCIRVFSNMFYSARFAHSFKLQCLVFFHVTKYWGNAREFAGPVYSVFSLASKQTFDIHCRGRTSLNCNDVGWVVQRLRRCDDWNHGGGHHGGSYRIDGRFGSVCGKNLALGKFFDP